jgi:hypothetical protein
LVPFTSSTSNASSTPTRHLAVLAVPGRHARETPQSCRSKRRGGPAIYPAMSPKNDRAHANDRRVSGEWHLVRLTLPNRFSDLGGWR